MSQNCAFSLWKLVHAVVTSPDGSTIQHQKDVNSLFTVDAKEMSIDLRLERIVKMPVNVMYALFSQKLDTAGQYFLATFIIQHQATVKYSVMVAVVAIEISLKRLPSVPQLVLEIHPVQSKDKCMKHVHQVM